MGGVQKCSSNMLQHAPEDPPQIAWTTNKRTKDAVGRNHGARELALLLLVRLRMPHLDLNATLYVWLCFLTVE